MYLNNIILFMTTSVLIEYFNEIRNFWQLQTSELLEANLELNSAASTSANEITGLGAGRDLELKEYIFTHFAA